MFVPDLNKGITIRDLLLILNPQNEINHVKIRLEALEKTLFRDVGLTPWRFRDRSQHKDEGTNPI